jgi:hypothetical protein
MPHRLGELFDAAWGVSAFFEAIISAHGYWSFGTAFRSIAAIWMIACTLIASLRAARVLLPDRGLPLRWSQLFVCGMWLSTVGFHALRELHAFALGWALLACTALFALAVFAPPDRESLAKCLWREGRALRRFSQRVRRGGHFGWWIFFASFGALLGLRAFVIPPLGWDTMTYHAPRAAQWVESGKFTFDDGVGPYSFYRHFFAGAEVLMAWAMLPFHSDLFVNLASVVQWIGLGLAGWALARAIGLREPFASTSACVVMFCPTLQLEVNCGYVELALNAALLHGIAVAVSCARRPSAGAIVSSALAFGVAIGIKLPGAPPAVVVAALLAAAVIVSRAMSWREKLRAGTIASLVALLPAAPWLVRAYRDTGYPLSPMPAKLFGVTLGVASPAMQWYFHRPQLTPFEWPAEKEALLAVFSPISRLNETLSAYALVPLLIFPLGLVALIRRRPFAALALSGAALMPVLAHYSDGMTPVRLLRAPSSARFLVPAFALIVAVSLAWCRRGQPLAAAYRWLLFGYPVLHAVLCLRRGWGGWEHLELAIVALAIALIIGGVVWLSRRHLLLSIGAAVLGWMWFCSGVQLRRDETRELALQSSYALVNFPRSWVDGVPFADEPDRPHQIAVTGGPDRSADKWFQYFFMGRRLQNRLHYVPPTPDGKVSHFNKRAQFDGPTDRDRWLQQLETGGIDEVLTFPPRSLEKAWMDALPDRFEKLAGDDDFGFYRLRR